MGVIPQRILAHMRDRSCRDQPGLASLFVAVCMVCMEGAATLESSQEIEGTDSHYLVQTDIRTAQAERELREVLADVHNKALPPLPPLLAQKPPISSSSSSSSSSNSTRIDVSEGLDTADLIGIVLLAVLALLMLAIILKPTMRAGARDETVDDNEPETELAAPPTQPLLGSKPSKITASSTRLTRSNRRCDGESNLTPTITPAAAEVLKSWFFDHIDRPFPNSREKDTLAALTHSSRPQVIAWFDVARGKYATGEFRRSTPAVDAAEFAANFSLDST